MLTSILTLGFPMGFYCGLMSIALPIVAWFPYKKPIINLVVTIFSLIFGFIAANSLFITCINLGSVGESIAAEQALTENLAQIVGVLAVICINALINAYYKGRKLQEYYIWSDQDRLPQTGATQHAAQALKMSLIRVGLMIAGVVGLSLANIHLAFRAADHQVALMADLAPYVIPVNAAILALLAIIVIMRMKQTSALETVAAV